MRDQDRYDFSPAKFFAWLPVYVLIAFALYVLSAGPMYWLIYGAFFMESNPYIAILYLPLVWMSSQSELFAGWLDWYVGLWVL